MWGNFKGWTISAILVVLCAATIYFIDIASSPTPPTAFSSDARNFEPIALPAPPTGMLPHARSDISGSAPDSSYARAIQLIEQNPVAYESFSRLGKLESFNDKSLPAIALALASTDHKIFANQPNQIVTFAHTKPDLEATQTLGKILIDRLGLLSARAGKTDDAMKCYQAAARLGQTLCDERLTYDEFQLGIELLAKSSAAMASLLEKTGKADQAAALRLYDLRRSDELARHVGPVLRIVRNINAKNVGTHAGDIFQLARRSRERMWRVEAIFALGRMRYFAGEGTAANQRAAIQLLRNLAEQDPDPIVRTAAAAARDLTIAEYRMQ